MLAIVRWLRHQFCFVTDAHVQAAEVLADPKQASKIVGMLSTYALVASLLLTATYPAVYEGYVADNEDGYEIDRSRVFVFLFRIANGFSVICSLMCISLCAHLMMMLNVNMDETRNMVIKSDRAIYFCWLHALSEKAFKVMLVSAALGLGFASVAFMHVAGGIALLLVVATFIVLIFVLDVASPFANSGRQTPSSTPIRRDFVKKVVAECILQVAIDTRMFKLDKQRTEQSQANPFARWNVWDLLPVDTSYAASEALVPLLNMCRSEYRKQLGDSFPLAHALMSRCTFRSCLMDEFLMDVDENCLQYNVVSYQTQDIVAMAVLDPFGTEPKPRGLPSLPSFQGSGTRKEQDVILSVPYISNPASNLLPPQAPSAPPQPMLVRGIQMHVPALSHSQSLGQPNVARGVQVPIMRNPSFEPSSSPLPPPPPPPPPPPMPPRGVQLPRLGSAASTAAPGMEPLLLESHDTKQPTAPS